MTESGSQTNQKKDWVPGLSRLIYESSPKTKIAWKRYPDEILEGEVRYMLERNGASVYPGEIILVSRVIKMYVDNPDLFYIPESAEQSKRDAGIGELLKNRTKGRSEEENEARKIMKVWISSDLESFLNSISSLLRFNAKQRRIVSLNDLFRLGRSHEFNPERTIQNISSGYFYARQPKSENTNPSESTIKEGDSNK